MILNKVCFAWVPYDTIVAKLVLGLTFSRCSFGSPSQEFLSLTYLTDHFNLN